MRAVLLIALLGACAQRTASLEPEPRDAEAVAGMPSPEERAAMPRLSPDAVRLARRLGDAGLGKLAEILPVRHDLPKPERCYGGAFLRPRGANDGWWYDLLVDLENPRLVWLRRIGTIAGIREYLGPAEIVDDSGPLVFRVAG